MSFFSRPMGRATFIACGISLFALKIALDLYITETWWGLALPFVAIGCALSLRRLRDAELSPWLVALLLVPFANRLFFLVCALAPPVARAEQKATPPQTIYRTGRNVDTRLDPSPRAFGASVFVAGTLGAAIAVGAIEISLELLRMSGLGVMLGAQAVAGFCAAMIAHRLRPGFGVAMSATLVSFGSSFGIATTLAPEDLGGWTLALPLIVPITFLSAAMGYVIALEADVGHVKGLAEVDVRVAR